MRRAAGVGAWLPWVVLVAMPLAALASWWLPPPGPAGWYLLQGRLPWSDGFDYWSAALHLMQTGTLDEWGSRRPLNGAFLAARLGLGGGWLSAAIVIQAALAGAALACVAAVAVRVLGAAAGVLATLMLGAAAAMVQCTTQSEGLAVILAASGTALLLHGAYRAPPHGIVSAAVGLAGLSVAMAARPGAILVVPALALWILWRWRRRLAPALVLVAAALLSGAAADAAARGLYAEPGAGANSNFAGTVLGLARGSDYYEAEAWIRERAAALPTEGERASLKYQEAWSAFKADPGSTLGSLFRNLGRFLLRTWPLLLAGAAGCMRSPPGSRGFWVAAWCGILCSVPIIYGDGGVRVLAATWPFMALSAASAFLSADAPGMRAFRNAWSMRTSRAGRDGVGSAQSLLEWPSLLAAGALVVAVPLAAVVGPGALRAAGAFASLPPAAGTAVFPRTGAQEVDRLATGPRLAIILVATAEERAARDPAWRGLRRVEPAALAAHPAVQEFGEPLAEIPTPFLLAVAYDLNQSRARVFTLPATTVTARVLAARPPAMLVHSNRLRDGGRVRVGVAVEAGE